MLFLLILTQVMTLQHKPKLIYVGDPMCSWCYGISNELEEVRDHFREIADFEIVMGGLRPYNKETMTDLKSFLTHHWDDVHKASGQPFNYNILNDGTITYDTEPPSRATVIVRSIAPEKAFQFFILIQKAFYQENKNMHLVESYYTALEALSVDKTEFNEKFHSDEMKNLVRKDFERSRQMGVQGFPSLILQQGNQLKLIANGYASSEKMIQRINNAMETKRVGQ